MGRDSVHTILHKRAPHDYPAHTTTWHDDDCDYQPGIGSNQQWLGRSIRREESANERCSGQDNSVRKQTKSGNVLQFTLVSAKLVLTISAHVSSTVDK